MKTKRLIVSMLIIFCTILLGIILCVFFAVRYTIVALEKPINAEFFYEHITNNDDYIGYHENSHKLLIISRESGKVIKEIDLLTVAEQVALGNEGIYVLYLNRKEDGTLSPEEECKVIRYPYGEGVATEYSRDNIYDIGCMDGKLYLLQGKELEDEYFECLPDYLNGFDANMYVEESEFGKTNPKKISPEDSKKLYDHNSLYYATEPDIGGYEGSIAEEFSIEDIFLRTDKDKQMHALLVDELDVVDTTRIMYFKYEYQSGERIYGICNQFERWRPRRPGNTVAASVEKSYLYSIDAKTMQIWTKTFNDNRMLLFASKDYYLYQRQGKVIKENIKSGESELLYQIKSLDDAEIAIYGNAILIVEDGKCFPIMWNDL